MYKTNDEIVKIQAKATTPIPTGVVFWSHDKGTAKLRFELLNGSVAQNIAEGSTVPIRLEFTSETAEGGKGKHDYLATIEDRVNGIVSVVLADNIMGYVGTVTGSIYIDFPNSTSIDTAGRFTFEIRRSPIDENTPEVEDYFFNGWSEIQKKLDEKIALTDLEIEKLKIKLDNLDKKADGIKATQETIMQSIADNELATKDDLEQAKQESSVNVIDQIVGKENAQLISISDFKGKVAGSDVENANKLMGIHSFEKPLLSNFTYEYSQVHYDAINQLNDLPLSTDSTKDAGKSHYRKSSFNLIKIFTDFFGEDFWTNQGILTKKEKITQIKKMIAKITCNIYGFGSGASGNQIEMEIFRVYDSSWIGTQRHTDSTVKKLSIITNESNSVNYIDDNGEVNILIFAPKSNGSIASVVNLDYLSIELTLKASASEYIKSSIAAYSGEKFVGLTGNQSISGVKNFLSAPMIDGKKVATVQDLGEIVHAGSGLTTIQSDKRSSFEEFVYQFRREGNEVRFFGRVKVKDATAITNSSADLIVPPVGFGMASNLKNTVSGVTLDTSQWTLPQGNYIGLLVNDGGSTPIKFASNKTGNVYISGSWPTDEAWPT